MLTITYDPINGKVVQDGFVKSWANMVVEDYKELISMNITVGPGIMIDATRVLIMKGKLNYKEVIYRFKGHNLGVNKDGGLSVWPKGFCDIYDNILEELLKCYDNKE